MKLGFLHVFYFKSEFPILILIDILMRNEAILKTQEII